MTDEELQKAKENWDFSESPNELSLNAHALNLRETSLTRGVEIDVDSAIAALRQAIIISYFHPEYWSAIAIDTIKKAKENGWDTEKLREGSLQSIENVEWAKNEANRSIADA